MRPRNQRAHYQCELPLRQGAGLTHSVAAREVSSALPVCKSVKPELKSNPTKSSAALRLRVTATAESIVRGGHPWVFADSVRELSREGSTGELAVIYDRKDRFLAIGLFDAASPIRVRVLHAGKPVKIDGAWWAERLAAGLKLRESIATQDTTGLRLIHGESDGWPGLVLDRYDEVLVLKLYTAAWLPLLGEVLKLVSEAMHPSSLVLRMSRNMQDFAESHFNRRDGELLAGNPINGPVVFRENGVAFEADVLKGQKTGFFLDQRENRKWVGILAKGREVLNAFSFSGGFSLYAAQGGAKSVTDLDISSHALESAKRNFALNRSNPATANCKHHSVQADAFDWLARNHDRKFDLIVLDPPSLAKREAERAGAIRAYQTLAGDAIRSLRSGGVLVACSCSAHVSAEEFYAAVHVAGDRSGRRFRELRTTGHPADHPAGFPEAYYLKGIYLQF